MDSLSLNIGGLSMGFSVGVVTREKHSLHCDGYGICIVSFLMCRKMWKLSTSMALCSKISFTSTQTLYAL